MSSTIPSPLQEILSQTVAAGNTAKWFSEEVNKMLPVLRAVNVKGHAGMRRELSLAITEIETGILWLGQYRRELQDRANETQARLTSSPEEGQA